MFIIKIFNTNSMESEGSSVNEQTKSKIEYLKNVFSEVDRDLESEINKREIVDFLNSRTSDGKEFNQNLTKESAYNLEPEKPVGWVSLYDGNNIVYIKEIHYTIETNLDLDGEFTIQEIGLYETIENKDYLFAYASGFSMIKGKTIFRCTNCHKVFVGIDVELMATALSAPIKCPKCGSDHTLPLFASKHLYKEIWEKMNNK